ncbi:major facilitator superfamily domain-containing protein [Xylariales sp. AK1849]|nr:major facilitator superfamily domain-containing protein [Xylariales sp. AK1849]
MEEKERAIVQPQTAPGNRDSPGLSKLEIGGIDLNTAPNPELFTVQNEKVIPLTADDASEAGSRARTLLGDETYPEGGKEAWLVVFGAFCGLFASLGLMNTLAIFQSYLSKHQLLGYSEGTVGWIFSLYTFLSFAFGVYVGPLFDKYGPKWLLLPGGLGTVLAVMLMSICTQYWHFLLTFGVLNGIASSLLFTPCLAAVGHFFRERRGMATGIASTGGGVGGVVFPLMLRSLFEEVGWAWAIRILGFVCLFLGVLCNLLVRKRLPPASNASSHPDFRIFKEKAMLLTTAAVFLLEFGLFIPLAYISSYAIAQGFDEDFSSTIVTILNAASVFGRFLPGYWADKIGPFNSNIISVFITVIACFAVWLPVGHTLPGIIVFVILFGFATGNNISITPVCVGRLCQTQHYGRYYSTCYTVVSAACLIGIPIGGNIVAATGGSYLGLIVLTGITEALALVTFLAAKGVSVGWKPWTKF